MSERVGSCLKELGITDYNFKGLYFYHQYRDCKSLDEFATAFNQLVAQTLKDFFTDFAKNINLKSSKNQQVRVEKNSYLFYYLQHYFGIFASMPYLSRASGYKNIYDSGYIKYDTEDITEPDHLYLYDDEIKRDAGSLYQDFNLTAAIFAWSLDRSHRVLNMPAIAELLQIMYKAFYQTELDLTTIKFIAKEDYLYIKLPNDSLWIFLQRLAEQDLIYLNLPFGRDVQFQIISSYYISMPAQVIKCPTTQGDKFKINNWKSNLNESNFLTAEFFSDATMTQKKDVTKLFSIDFIEGIITNNDTEGAGDLSSEFPVYVRLTAKDVTYDAQTLLITDKLVINYGDTTTEQSEAINFEAEL